MRDTTSRSWSNITDKNSPAHARHFDIPINRRKHIQGYVSFIKDRIFQEWVPTFLTFQFQQLPGKANAVLEQMKKDIETVYRKLVPRIQRFPTTRLGSQNVPIILSCADLPVFKRRKGSLADVSINDGLHHHGIALLPPKSRLKTDLVSHLAQEQGLYLRGSRLASIFAESIDENVERAVQYAFKGISSGRIDYDNAFLVFPRALSELP